MFTYFITSVDATNILINVTFCFNTFALYIYLLLILCAINLADIVSLHIVVLHNEDSYAVTLNLHVSCFLVSSSHKSKNTINLIFNIHVLGSESRDGAIYIVAINFQKLIGCQIELILKTMVLVNV